MSFDLKSKFAKWGKQSVQGATSSAISPWLVWRKTTHKIIILSRKKIQKPQKESQVSNTSPRTDSSAVYVTCNRAHQQNNNILNIHEKRQCPTEK